MPLGMDGGLGYTHSFLKGQFLENLCIQCMKRIINQAMEVPRQDTVELELTLQWCPNLTFCVFLGWWCRDICQPEVILESFVGGWSPAGPNLPHSPVFIPGEPVYEFLFCIQGNREPLSVVVFQHQHHFRLANLSLEKKIHQEIISRLR
jgi:hypothetical protein